MGFRENSTADSKSPPWITFDEALSVTRFCRWHDIFRRISDVRTHKQEGKTTIFLRASSRRKGEQESYVTNISRVDNFVNVALSRVYANWTTFNQSDIANGQSFYEKFINEEAGSEPTLVSDRDTACGHVQSIFFPKNRRYISNDRWIHFCFWVKASISVNEPSDSCISMTTSRDLEYTIEYSIWWLWSNLTLRVQNFTIDCYYQNYETPFS